MRLNGQKVIYAVSQFAPERMRTVDGIIAHKEENQRAQNAEDRFRAEPQRMRQMLRASSRRELLQTADLNLFLQRFTPWSEHFIQPAGATYEQPGSYYEQHQHITPRNRDPIQELNAMRNHLIQRAAQMGVPHDALQQVQYTEEMRPHFPQQVSPLTATEGQQLEVEEEREEQNEIQQEQQMEEETESVNSMSRAASYLPRNRQANAVFSAHERIHPAFDPRIEFTNNFLPLNRQDPLHRRTPFDTRMFRVGSIKIYIDWTHYYDYPNPERTEIFRVVIGDSLDAVEYNRVYDVDLAPRNTSSIEYDIRTDQVIHNGVIRPTQEFNPAQNQQFQAILAQIKFMDGQIEGYTQEQLDHLTAWFQQNNNLQELRQLFENRILRYRSERNRYRHSQLWNHFQTIARV